MCQSSIEWRREARRLLLFSTDAGFHYAGDGKVREGCWEGSRGAEGKRLMMYCWEGEYMRRIDTRITIDL